MTEPIKEWNPIVDGKCSPDELLRPLKWRKPQRVFVNSMSDLFHEDITNEEIAAVFGVMASCPRHTFQVLTKRPQRMLEWFKWVELAAVTTCVCAAQDATGVGSRVGTGDGLYAGRAKWPLPNVWLGACGRGQVAEAGEVAGNCESESGE